MMTLRYGKRLYAVVFLLLFMGCGDFDYPTATEELNPPLGLKAEKSGGGVKLTWYGSNFEQNFDGYNVYISDKQKVHLENDDETVLRYEDTIPTLRLQDIKDRNVDERISYKITSNDLVDRFGTSEDFTLYTIVRAHSSSGEVSDRSNEASVSL